MEDRQKLNLETFGEIMDRFIHQNKMGLMITKDADSDDWDVAGAGMGAVLDFYIFLNAIGPIYQRMLKEMEIKDRIDAEKLAESLTDLIREDLINAAKET